MGSFLLGQLPRDMREELFGLHASSVDPDATERRFYAKRVPLSTLSLAGVAVDSFPPESLEGLIRLGPEKWAPVVIADGRLVDGQHRIQAARLLGLSSLPAIDLTGLIDTDVTGFVSALPAKKNPSEEGPWTGTPKQIAWAKSIKARLLPQIQAERAAFAKDFQTTKWKGRQHSSAITFCSRALRALDTTIPACTSARFWIDMRDASPTQIVLAVARMLGEERVP